MDEKTPIQRQIEDVVTNGRGYDRRNTEKTPERLINTEIGVQITLTNMDVGDAKLDMDAFCYIIPRIEALIKKFDKTGIPLEVITDAEGFRRAFDSAYAKILDNDRDVTYRRVAELTNFS